MPIYYGASLRAKRIAIAILGHDRGGGGGAGAGFELPCRCSLFVKLNIGDYGLLQTCVYGLLVFYKRMCRGF